MKCCIITAVSHNLWSDYLLFYNSLFRFNCFNLVVVGLDINDNQKEFIRRQTNTNLVEIEQSVLSEFKKISNDWAKWCKPLFIKHISENFDLVLWIDCDTIIAKSLDELFSIIRDQFFVVADYFAPQQCYNKPNLYDYYNITEVTPHVINSGVVGFRFPRDDYIIDQWVGATNDLKVNKQIMENVTLYDQGLLLLAVQKFKLYDCISTNINFNYPARRLLFNNKSDYVDFVINNNHGSVIIHFAGLLKASHVRIINHPTTLKYNRSRYGDYSAIKKFVGGFEYLIDQSYYAMSENSSDGVYVDKYESPEQPLEHIDDKNLKLFDRTDASEFVVFGQQLPMVFDQLRSRYTGCMCVAMVGDPLLEVKYKIDNFCIPHSFVSQTPLEYQFKYNNAMLLDNVKLMINKSRPIISNNLFVNCLSESLMYVSSLTSENCSIYYNFKSLIDNLVSNSRNGTFSRSWKSKWAPKAEWYDHQLSVLVDDLKSLFFEFVIDKRIISTQQFP